jgi:nucleoside-diphosphate-sugar epimerase
MTHVNNGNHSASLIGDGDRILVTGASGFIGARLVATLVNRGFRNVVCLVRASSDVRGLEKIASVSGHPLEIVKGNLLSRDDCAAATKDAAVIFHLAASTGEKSFPDAVMNSVVTTRNLVEASLQHGTLRRFVHISSFAVYSNMDKPHGRLLDESSPLEPRPELRGEAYAFAKLKQEQLVTEYGERCGLPYVILRPGAVYGPGSKAITGRVGTGTFGVFLHLGGGNTIPFTYVDNCAEAIALAGLRPGIDREVFNIVDDDLPSSRQFLRLYKKHARALRTIYLPHPVSYALCALWERYSIWSHGQLPLAFNRRRWHAYWKKTRYTNQKLKDRLGWAPAVSTAEGLRRYFASCREARHDA